MPYVSRFKHDVFVSYAQVANSNWVKDFLGKLHEHLDRELHQSGASSIFWDRRELDGNSPLTDEITQSISSTATLVIVVSHAYLDRPWCRKERETFFAQFSDAKRRAFLVFIEDVPFDRRPTHIQDMDVLGYQFWEQHPESENTEITRPLPVKDDRGENDYAPFDARIRELAIGIRDRLLELKGNSGSSTTGTKVFVADGDVGARFKALQEARSQLRNRLSDSQLTVLPEASATLYEQFIDPLQREKCRAQAEDLMKKSTVVVQLLGTTGDQDGYEQWICDRAIAAGKVPGNDLLLWRPQSMLREHITSDVHRELVFSVEMRVVASDLTDFARDLEQRIKQILVNSTAQQTKENLTDGPGTARRGFVVIDNDDRDETLSVKLMAALTRHDVGYTSVMDGLNEFKELAFSDPVDGIVFTFGACDMVWAKERFRATRPLWMNARTRPRIAVLKADPLRPLPTNVDAIKVIHIDDEDGIKAFAEEIREVSK